MSSRRPVAAANWKMNLLASDARTFGEALRTADLSDVDVLFFPPATVAATLVQEVASTTVEVGGQDLHAADSGAHTGDLSAAHWRDAGCRWVLCGHSERRADHGEGDEAVGAKVAAGLRGDLEVMLCLGETLEEREAEATQAVLERQLRVGWNAARRAGATDGDVGRLAIAYEPVWAIGTGKTATPELAQDAHAFLRSLAGDLFGAEAAAGLRLLYGGSVKPGNCRELIVQTDIDGFLVGGASLDPGSFLDIIAGCAQRPPS
ncbi:MAG: triose-phosphate isomerase [Acidobacteriota bacterium]